MIKYYVSSSPDYSIDIKDPFLILLSNYDENIKSLNLKKIKKLLQLDKINVNKIDSIKIFNKQKNAFIEFKNNYQIYEDDIVLLLHFSEDNDKDLENLDKKISKIKKRIENKIKIDKSIDLIFLYASPIVNSIVNRNEYNENEFQLDYRGEIKKIFNSIENKKNFNVIFDYCDFYILNKSIRKYPKILHLSCHGCIEKNEFYLCLEEKGVKCSISLDKICKVIEQEKRLNEIDLVFISACHSKPLGEKFLELGVKNVICISSETPITDIAAQKFSQEFYSELFNGESIKNAFEKTKNSFNDIEFNKELKICCCEHKHKNDCFFNKNIHHNKFHIKTCKCIYNEYHIHKYDCKFLKFLKSNNFCSIKMPNNTEKICCCSPEIPHNESSKFILLSTDKDHVINFEDKKENYLNLNCAIKYYKEKKNKIFGRGKEIKQVYDMFENNINFILVIGKRFVGKKFFAESAAIYLIERKMIKKFEKIQINSSLSINYLCNQIKSFDHEDFNKSEILFIIHFSIAIKNEIETVKAVLSELRSSFNLYKYLILIDINEEKIDNEYNFIKNEFNVKEYDSIKIDTLNIESAKKYLNQLIYNIYLSEKDLEKLIEEIEYYPNEIDNLSHIIQNETRFDNIYKKTIEEKNKNKINNYELENFLKNKNTKELLFLLASLPKGLYQNELLFLKVEIEKNKEINNFIKKEELNEIIYKIDEKYIYKILLNFENDEELINQYLKKIIKMYSIIFNIYLNDIREENLKKNSNYEFNALNYYGIWKTFNEINYKKCFKFQIFDISFIKDVKNYLENSRFNIELLIENNKNNLKKLLNDDEEFLEYFEQLLLYLPTIFKYNKLINECIDLLNQYIKLCIELNLNNSKERLKLFLYSMEYYPNFQPKNFSHEILSEGRAEAFLLNAYKEIEIDENEDVIIENLENALKIFEKNDKIKIKTCFVNWILGQYYYKLYLNKKKKYYWEKMEKYFNNAINYNGKIDKIYKIYKIKFQIEFGTIYQKQKQYEKAKNYLTLANELANEIKNELSNELSNESSSMEFAKEFNIKYIEYFIQNTQNILYSINKNMKYNITILSANPLKNEKNGIYAYNNSQINFLKRLKNSKLKNLKIKFDVLNKENLEECLSSSGEILIIRADDFNNDGDLIMEEKDGNSKIIENKILLNLFKNSANEYKIIILAFLNSENLFKLFHKFEVKFKYIITFDIIHQILKPENYFKLNKNIDKFILNFLENCQNETIEKSFSITKSNENFKLIKNIIKLRGEFNEKLFSSKNELKKNNNHFNRKIEPNDLIKIDVLAYLKKIEMSELNRFINELNDSKQIIYELINKINFYKKVNLYGSNKIIKKDKIKVNMKILIAKEIALFYHRHNQFNDDGIYYKEIKRNDFYKPNDILKKLNIQNYSSDKPIFIIINDFNEILINNITKILKPNFYLLYITNKPIKKNDFFKYKLDYNNDNDDINIKYSSKSLVDDKKKNEDFYSMKSNVSDNSSLNIRRNYNTFISSNFENNNYLMNPSDIIDLNEKDINNCSFVSIDENELIINDNEDYYHNNNINSINYISNEDNNNNLINNKDNEYNYDINDISNNNNNNSYEDNYFDNDKYYNINK